MKQFKIEFKGENKTSLFTDEGTLNLEPWGIDFVGSPSRDLANPTRFRIPWSSILWVIEVGKFEPQ